MAQGGAKCGSTSSVGTWAVLQDTLVWLQGLTVGSSTVVQTSEGVKARGA